MSNEEVIDMDKFFEKIASRLQPVLPVGWNKVCLYAEIAEKSYEIFFYCFINGTDGAVQCYDLMEEYQIEEEEIDEAFEDIYAILELIWQELKKLEEKTWTNYTLIFESTGRFKEYFDYTDLENGSYEYKKKWKEKYLTSDI